MMIVGLCGQAGSGKDTIADHLVGKHGFVKVALADEMKRICQRLYGWSDETLWGPSDKRNEPDFNLPRGDLRGSETGEFHRKKFVIESESGHSESAMVHARLGWLTPRHALQALGTEWGRAMYQNTWVDITIRTARKLLDRDLHLTYSQPGGLAKDCAPYLDANGIVVPDVRYRNEIDAIQAAGGLVARVTRPGAGLEGAAGQHTSETEQLEIPDDILRGGVFYNIRTIEELCGLVDLAMDRWKLELA